MKHYVSPELRLCIISAQDVITASNDLEFDVTSWLGDGSNNGGFVQ